MVYSDLDILKAWEKRNAKLKRARARQNEPPKGGKKAKKQAKQESRSRAALGKVYPSYRQDMGGEFYQTLEWRDVRWAALRNSDGRCVMCGRSKACHGVTLHVDHIKPRFLYPELELRLDNLQVLCEDCNLGKGVEVWRPNPSSGRTG